MFRKLLCSMVVMVVAISFAAAEEFTLQITGIAEDGALTGTKIAAPKKGTKGGGFGGKGEMVTVKVAKGLTVHKGKADAEKKGTIVADGDDLKIAGLRTALTAAQNGNVLVSGTALTSKDTLELAIRDGKPTAKLNGKEVQFADVSVKGKANSLTTRVTTNDDGVATSIIIGGGGGGFGGGIFPKKDAKVDPKKIININNK